MSIGNKKTVKRYIVKRDLKGLFPKEFTSRELIGKFFDYVMNNFFEKSYERYVNGYIGKKTQTLEEGNYYITEPTAERQLYQLTPMLVDTDSENNIKDIVDYTNFINTLKTQGALTNDHNRLLCNEHWSYSPPIDADMFLNYNFYYWIEEGVKPIIIENVVDIDEQGQAGNQRGTNVVVNLIGRRNYNYNYLNEYDEVISVPVYNGMRIILRNDSNFEYNNKPFIIEGVGKSIILIDDSEIYNIDDDTSPDYFVMERGAKDENPWSLRNRWFHITDIKNANLINQTDADKTKYIQAKKPILCFNRDIELYNFGSYGRGWVDAICDIQKNEINGQVLDKSNQDGKLPLGNQFLDTGAKILFVNEPVEENNNMIYELFLIDNGDTNLVSLYPVVNGRDPDGKALKGDCVKVRNRLNNCYHFDGKNWILSQQKTKVCQSPLFNLYDKNTTPLDDKNIYPNSSFRGCTIFNYKPVTNRKATIDEDLKRRYSSDGYGNYIFVNSIVSDKITYKDITTTDIKVRKEYEGYRYYKINGENPSYLNNWILSKDKITQYVITEITVGNDIEEYVMWDEKNLPLYYNVFDIAYEPSENDYKKNIFVYVNGQLLNNETFFIDDYKLYISKQYELKEFDTIFIKMLVNKMGNEMEIIAEEPFNTYDLMDNNDNLIASYNIFRLNQNYSDNLSKNLVYVYLNDNLIAEDKYFIKNHNLYINKTVTIKNNDKINVKILNNTNNEELADGYVYDIPLMLTANCLNEDIEEIKYNETFSHFESILENQNNFEGVINGINNYKDTTKDLSLGTKILQHSTPILKTMLLNSKEYTNVKTVLTYICNEYTRFKNRFNLTINNFVNNGTYKEFDPTGRETDPFPIIIKALKLLNVGKEGLQPFYNNGVAEQLINQDEEDINYLPYLYIPATPAYLGLDNCYEPKIIDKSIDLKDNVLLCHDGSYAQIYHDYRDNALLEMEKEIYDSIPLDIKEHLPAIIKQKYIPGRFRETDYSYDDYLKLYTPLFEKWIVENNLDYSINNTFNEYDPFTWNWSSCYDDRGFKLPGSYRGIYMYYYDTDKPHTNPWEMLGFGDKPDWWEKHYGVGPYTSENYPMWKDIEEGHIIDGLSEGYYNEFKRPGLTEKYLPVDINGNLLPPYEAGIATAKPIIKYASDPWKIGDLGYVENMWRYTPEYRYAMQTLLYLMKPLEWIEKSWDSLNTATIFKNTNYEQIINIDSGIRNLQNDVEMHNELINGEYLRKIGSQQWFSDFLTSENINITNYIANDLRNINVQLGYRCAGFFDKKSMRLLSDNYGLIPDTNYHLNMNQKIIGKIFNYSAMIITKVDNTWILDGYDTEHPYFDILLPKKNGKTSTVEIGGRNFTYYHEYLNAPQPIRYKTVFTSAQELYNTIIGYGKYLESIGFVFNLIDPNGEMIDFKLKGREFLVWYDNQEVTSGMKLVLNPMDTEINLKHKGFVDKVGQFINGKWSISDISSYPIYNKDLKIYRHNGYITIKPKRINDIICNIKLLTSEKENIMIIDNETIYGDVLYNSLKGTKTERFKLLGIKANGWNGTYYAPGYVFDENNILTPDYDKLANDFNFVYDSDDIRSFGDMGEEAKKTIGYHKTKYMENLLIDDRNMFNFYKGMLKEKGTRLAFNKLNRSTHIMSEGSSKLNLDEHWVFNVGQFGYTKNKSALEFHVDAESINHDPQIITFSTDPNYKSTDVSNIAINWKNKNWLKDNDNQDENSFHYKSYSKKLTIGGFAQLDDVDRIIDTKDNLIKDIDNIGIGERIWVVKDTEFTWNVYKKIDNEINPLKPLKVRNINELLSYDCHYLEKGDLIYVQNDILNNWVSRLSDDENGKELNIYINDTHDLIHNPNYNIKKVGWSVFEYNGLIPYSYIISMPNGLISIINDTSSYAFKVEKDVVINTPNGINSEGFNIYKEYILPDSLNIKLYGNGKYLFINDKMKENVELNDEYKYYYLSSTFIKSEYTPEEFYKNDFWYNPKFNTLSRYNGFYWDNSNTPLYCWKNGNTKVYTLSFTPGIRYAWKNGNSLVFTDREYPVAGDTMFKINGRETGYVTTSLGINDYFYSDDVKYDRDPIDDIIINTGSQSTSFTTVPTYKLNSYGEVTKNSSSITTPYTPYKYAWNNDSTIYYTDREYPIAGDSVYNVNNVEIGVVTSYFDGNDFFYIDETRYIRSAENDIKPLIKLGSTKYYRDENSDIPATHYSLIAETKIDVNAVNGIEQADLVDISINNPFTLLRVEQKPINMDLINSVYLLDDTTDKTFAQLHLYDPLHGILPDFVLKELDYITSYDPVDYDNGNNWFDEKLGRLWWDTSKVRYIDYYQGDLKYRRDNWGKQLPGSEIAIMEWSKSTILPEDIGDKPYLTREVYNPETDKNDTFYYFWVLNPAEVPYLDFRTTSAYDISRKINSPQDEGIIWFSPINLVDRIYNDSSFIIGNFDDVTTSQNFDIQINFKNESEVDDHNEWFMIVENSSDLIPDPLWNKMKHSLMMENDFGEEVPDEDLTDHEKYGITIRPRQSMFKNIIKARRNFVDACNDLFSSRTIDYVGVTDDIKYLNVKDESYKNYDLVDTFPTHNEMITTPDKMLVGNYILVEHDEYYDNIWTLWKCETLDEFTLVDYQKYGMDRYTYLIDAFINKKYSPTTYDKKIYSNRLDETLANLKNPVKNPKGIKDGYLLRVDDYLTKEWLYLLEYDASVETFITVGVKDGYLQISDELYEYMLDKSLLNNYKKKLNDEEYEEFIDGLTEYEYIDREVKILIEIICDYFDE